MKASQVSEIQWAIFLVGAGLSTGWFSAVLAAMTLLTLVACWLQKRAGQ